MTTDVCLVVQAMKDAVKMEEDGLTFYQKAAQAAKTPGTREIFDYLAESEKYHIKRIRELYERLEKDPTWTEGMCAWVQPHQRPNVFTEAMAQASAGQGEAEDIKALEVGIAMEEKSIAYYQKLAQAATDPLERRLFLSLVNEERGHYNALVDYRNYLIDPADWYYVKEMGHVDGA